MKRILSGKLTEKYLGAYYPKTPGESDTDVPPEEKLEKIVNGYFQNEYGFINYILPLISLIVIVGIGFFFFLEGKYRLLVLSNTDTAFLADIPTTVYLGFMGAYIYGFLQTYKRYASVDFTPTFLYTITLKILICSILGYLWGLIFQPISLAYFVSFGSGFIPISFLLNYIKKTTQRKLGNEENIEKPSDLSNIQGLNKANVNRLEEEGIYNCQNLAYCDPIKLVIKTNFQLKILLDWIDQALLYIYVGDRIQELKIRGIRGVVEMASLHETEEDETFLKSIASEINITFKQLKSFVGNLYEDPHVDFIWDLLSEYENDKEKVAVKMVKSKRGRN